MSESQSGSDEIMLFGVRVKVDPLRKSVSMNDMSQYVQPPAVTTRESSSTNNNNINHASAVVSADSGYASADDAAGKQLNGGGKERKRGVPWTEDEHKLFLLGLQTVGKGDWRGISRKYVKTRTPTQVASHAQKYFLRRSNLNRRRRRFSLFDITTDSVAAIPMEQQQVNEDNNSQTPVQASQQISALSGFPMETVTFNNHDQYKGGPLLPTPNLSTRGDDYLDQKHERNSLSLSLFLNLPLSCDHNIMTDSSVFQAISGFNNGDGIISVG